MKLRIRGNSLRLRLNMKETEELSNSARVEESVCFGPNDTDKLFYSVSINDSAKEISAKFIDGRIDVVIPSPIAVEWLSTDRVGISSENEVSENERLSILLEKDFACLKPRDDEEEAFSFPNPSAGEEC